MAILSLLRTLKRDDLKKETARHIFSAIIETIAILAQFYHQTESNELSC